MKHNLLWLGALLCALIVSVRDSSAQEASQVKPHCVATAEEEIQKCLDQTVLGSDGKPKHVPVLVLCGDYWITRQLNAINVPLFTGYGESGCKARFYAHPTLGNQRILFLYAAEGSEFAFIELHGNKDERMRESERRDSAWPEACKEDDQRPPNIEIHGRGINAHDFASREAICGSALGVRGELIRVTDAVIENNGFEEGAWPYRSTQYSDNVTVLYCSRCEFARLKLRNGTDISFVLGGGGDNWIHDNECVQTAAYGFACFNWGQFYTGHKDPVTGRAWDGIHRGNVVENNYVFAEKDKLGYGFAIGKDFFISNPDRTWLKDVGTIRYNRSVGAKNNFSIDGVEEGRIYGNLFSEARGTRKGAYSHCDRPLNYSAGHFGGKVALQPGFEHLTLDGGICKPQ